MAGFRLSIAEPNQNYLNRGNQDREQNAMKTKSIVAVPTIILTCVLLLVAPLFARESTDVVVMKNGDHLTGEIKGLNDGVLYMSMQYILGTSSVQWSKVERLESKQLFLVKQRTALFIPGHSRARTLQVRDR